MNFMEWLEVIVCVACVLMVILDTIIVIILMIELKDDRTMHKIILTELKDLLARQLLARRTRAIKKEVTKITEETKVKTAKNDKIEENHDEIVKNPQSPKI